MDIEKNIDNILVERGMSRRQLAKLACIPPTTLQSAMSRGSSMSMDMVQKIANALNVSVGDLLGVHEDLFAYKGKNIEDLTIDEIAEMQTHFNQTVIDLLIKRGVPEENIVRHNTHNIESDERTKFVMGGNPYEYGFGITNLNSDESEIVAKTVMTLFNQLVKQCAQRENKNIEE